MLLLFLPVLAAPAADTTAAESWQLIDRFKDIPVGEWVRLKYSGGSEHLLLVAARDDAAVTLEEKVHEQGYLTSWTQVVIDLAKKAPVAVREKTPDGEIHEVRVEGEKSSLAEELYALLTARFRQEPRTELVVVPAGRFACKVYRSVYDDKFIQIFFSDKIPLYPVKVVIPGYELTIRLVAFGKGMESRFFPRDKSPKSDAAEAPASEPLGTPPSAPENNCEGKAR